ncbi:uncharacterized protein LOC106666312 [Cimex lectularius]|uniref:C-type lectin domain-containing protein n=1 Tax=Cimex lectularius TaxID=79782 RepID=A0A8I6RSM8_CIMLE|nr:uncharacterized protein LOC106666312 [Cimex lectularius]
MRADKVPHELYLDEATGKKFYLGFFGQLNWCEAHRFCASHGMQLMPIKDPRISNAVVKILSGYGGHDFKIWVDVYKTPNSNAWVVSEGNNHRALSKPQIQDDTGWLTWAVVDRWHITVDKDSFPKQFFDSSPFYNEMYQSNWTDSGPEAERWPISKVKRPNAEDFRRKSFSRIISQIATDEEPFKEIWDNFNFSSVIDDPIVLLDEPIDRRIESADSVRDDIVFENLEGDGTSISNAYNDKEAVLSPPKIVINNDDGLNCASVGLVNQTINVLAESCNSHNYFICEVL